MAKYICLRHILKEIQDISQNKEKNRQNIKEVNMVAQFVDNKTIDVAEFIRNNYTPYYGDDSFLSGPTQRTMYMWSKVSELMKE